MKKISRKEIMQLELETYNLIFDKIPNILGEVVFNLMFQVSRTSRLGTQRFKALIQHSDE